MSFVFAGNAVRPRNRERKSCNQKVDMVRLSKRQAGRRCRLKLTVYTSIAALIREHKHDVTNILVPVPILIMGNVK
jgi:hypothetical protein